MSTNPQIATGNNLPNLHDGMGRRNKDKGK